MEKVAVVGGGPAGCYAAYQLQQRGHRVVLFEAAPAVGGRTQSYRHDGYTLDTGAAFITNFYPITHRLIKSLNLQQSIVAVNRTTALQKANNIAELKLGSAKSFLQYPFLTTKEKAKMAFHVSKLVARRFQYHLTDLRKLAKYDDASIAEYARRELTENIYQSVVRPGVEPFWYFSCESASRALYLALSAHAPDAKFYVFTDGIDRLCHALVKNVELVLNQTVAAVTPCEAGLRVQTGEGGQGGDVFDRVVIATTAPVARAITETISDDWICETQRAFLTSQRYVANTHCVFRTAQFPRSFNAFSLFPCGVGTHDVAALSFNSEKCPQLRAQGEELISVYLGSEFSQRVREQHDSDIAPEDLHISRTFTQADFSGCDSGLTTQMASAYEAASRLCDELPALSEVSPFYCVQRQEAIPIHTVGRYRQALAFQQAQKQRAQNPCKYGDLPAAGKGVYFVGDYLSTATVEGALASVAAIL